MSEAKKADDARAASANKSQKATKSATTRTERSTVAAASVSIGADLGGDGGNGSGKR